LCAFFFVADGADHSAMDSVCADSAGKLGRAGRIVARQQGQKIAHELFHHAPRFRRLVENHFEHSGALKSKSREASAWKNFLVESKIILIDFQRILKIGSAA
jgi:hypothetical protein